MTDPCAQTVIPFGQVPQGSFFRVAQIPESRWQKVAHGISVTDDYKMIRFKEDAPCILEWPDGAIVGAEHNPEIYEIGRWQRRQEHGRWRPMSLTAQAKAAGLDPITPNK